MGSLLSQNSVFQMFLFALLFFFFFFFFFFYFFLFLLFPFFFFFIFLFLSFRQFLLFFFLFFFFVFRLLFLSISIFIFSLPLLLSLSSLFLSQSLFLPLRLAFLLSWFFTSFFLNAFLKHPLFQTHLAFMVCLSSCLSCHCFLFVVLKNIFGPSSGLQQNVFKQPPVFKSVTSQWFFGLPVFAFSKCVSLRTIFL